MVYYFLISYSTTVFKLAKDHVDPYSPDSNVTGKGAAVVGVGVATRNC
jgi:hypothetical protein